MLGGDVDAVYGAYDLRFLFLEYGAEGSHRVGRFSDVVVANSERRLNRHVCRLVTFPVQPPNDQVGVEDPPVLIIADGITLQGVGNFVLEVVDGIRKQRPTDYRDPAEGE